MNKVLLLLSTIVLLSFSCASNKYSFNPSIDQSTYTDILKYKIDSLVLSKMVQYQIPGLSVGLVSKGAVVYVKGYGVRNISTQEKVSANTIFHAASISKLFTAQAAMKLIKEGKLNLNDRVVELIPQIQSGDPRFGEVSVKQLLNHTSGLPDITNYGWQKNNQSKDALAQYILSQKFKLKSAPSQSFSYSNLGSDLLGYIVEHTAGLPFEDYIESTLFKEAGMRTSDFRYFKIADSLRTSPHSKKRISGKIYTRKHYPYTREHGPSSTLNTSSAELCKWMNFVLSDLDNKKEGSLFYEMIQSSTDLNNYIGLGFQLYQIDSHKAVGHYGGDKGFRSYLVMLPQQQIGLCLLANCDYNEDFRQEILHSILKLILP